MAELSEKFTFLSKLAGMEKTRGRLIIHMVAGWTPASAKNHISELASVK